MHGEAKPLIEYVCGAGPEGGFQGGQGDPDRVAVEVCPPIHQPGRSQQEQKDLQRPPTQGPPPPFSINDAEMPCQYL